jgi:endoglucanase
MTIRTIFILIAACSIAIACRKKHDDESTSIDSRQLHASGIDIIDGSGKKVYLRGVAFGNEVWSNAPTIPTTHHSEEDYKRVRDMGMNAIRFYLNYQIFEDDATPYVYKSAAWDWIDQNIAWAKKHDIYLILNMHVPQGGFQSNGDGDALWNNPENQNRLKALWFNIAKRYANEPTIAGLDLLNEPVVTTSIDQWKNFSQSIIDTIRTVNTNSMIIVERVNAIDDNWSNNSDMNFFDLNDNNLAYEFHFYLPMEFTHQGASWIGGGNTFPIGQTYPDANRVFVKGNSFFYTASFANARIPTGTYDWMEYAESPKYKIQDEKIKLGKPTVVNRANTGKIWVDDIVVKEYDASDNFVRNVFEIDLNTFDGWYSWSENGSGTAGADGATGHSNSNSLYMQGTTGDANISSTAYQFIPKQGYSYTISGWVKGEDVTAGSAAMFRLDFEQIADGDNVYSLGKEYLAAQVDQYYKWTHIKNKPLFLGEFGVIQFGYENNLGGLQWTGDMIDILKERDAHFTYHAYHEDSFGIYKGYGTPVDPSTGNQALINLFKSKLP